MLNLVLIVKAPHREGMERLTWRAYCMIPWHVVPRDGETFEVSEGANLAYVVKGIRHRVSRGCIEVHFEADKPEDLSMLLEKGDGWKVLQDRTSY